MGKKKVSKVHPVFDIEKAVWFVGKIEAPSLRELKKLLPSRTQIIGYYPDGFKAPAWPKNSGLIKGRMPIAISLYVARPSVKAPPATEKPVNFETLELRDEALIVDWAAGMTREAIAIKYQFEEINTVSKILRKARERGDARAAQREKKRQVYVTRKPKYDHNTILNLWAEGLTGPEIGLKLRLPRSTTAAVIVADYRKRGDPRAIRRAPVYNKRRS